MNRGPENTIMSWPHLFWAELAVFIGAFRAYPVIAQNAGLT